MKPDLLVETSFLATKNKLEDKILSCGKVFNDSSSGNFLFYLVEINSRHESAVVNKIVQVMSNSTKTVKEITDQTFENLLGLINETLGRLSKTTDNLWLDNLNAIIGFVSGGEILISQTGKINGYIFRHNKISSLSDQNESEQPLHPNRIFTDITAGEIAKGDQLIFGNEDLFNHISVDRLRNFVKLENICDEAVELSRYLKRTKIKTANAILIRATDQLNLDLPETIYLDEPEETMLSTVSKELKPVANKLWLAIKEGAKYVHKHSKIAGKQLQKEWKEKYGPKSQELLYEGSQKLKTSLSSSRRKFEELNQAKSTSNLKIRSHSYRDETKATFLSSVDWSKIGKIRVIFERRNRKILYAVLIALALIFGYSKIKINNEHRAEKIKEVEVANAYDQAREMFQSAKEDLLLGKTDSLDKLNEALALAEKAKENENNRESAVALIKDINDLLDEKTKTVRFYNSLSFQMGEDTKKIVLAGSEIYGITGEGKIYVADTRDKDPKLVASIGQEKGAVVSMAYMAPDSIIIATDQQKLLSFDIPSKTAGEISNIEGKWKGLASLATYSTNIYSLDPTGDTIWKYILTGSTYSKANDYADTRKTSLKNAIGLAVDGNIFVLKSDGSVVKFVKGSYEEDFAIRNIPAPNNKIEEPAQIYTDEDTNNIFVLDKGKNRILKFDKAGDFVNQYIFDNVAIDGFIVNTRLQKIWALSDNKIFEGNL